MDLQLMPAHTAVSVDKARRMLAWTPRLSLDEGMAICEAWLRAEGYLPPLAADDALLEVVGRRSAAR
jgi:hypothetical protein